MDMHKLYRCLIKNRLPRLGILSLLIFTFLCSQKLQFAKAVDMGLGEYMLFSISDHYFLIYCWFFFILLVAINKLHDKNDNERLRYKTVKEYYFYEVCSKGLLMAGLIALHILIPLLLGSVSLRLGNSFTTVFDHNLHDGNLEVLEIYSLNFKTPMTAVIPAVFVWWFGSFVLDISIFMVNEFRKKALDMLFVGLMVLSTILGFYTAIDEGTWQFLFFNNYFIFHHAYLVNNMAALITDLLMGILALIVLTRIALRINTNHSIRRLGFYRFLYGGKAKLLITVFVLLTLLSIFRSDLDPAVMVWDLNKGFSYSSFGLTEFLFYIFPIAAMLFCINAINEKNDRDKLSLLMFRSGRRRNWDRILDREETRFFLLTTSACTVLVMLINSVGLLVSRSSEFWNELASFYGIEEETVFVILFLCPLMRAVEWFILLRVDRLILRTTGNSIISYAVTMLLWLPGFISDFISPAGKGGAYQIFELMSSHRLAGMVPVLLVYGASLALIPGSDIGRRLERRKERSWQQ